MSGKVTLEDLLKLKEHFEGKEKIQKENKSAGSKQKKPDNKKQN